MSRPARVAVFGLNGGVGRTTVTAHLSRLLYELGHVPMAFDLDPQNSLGLHLGMPPGEWAGLTTPSIDRRAVGELLRKHGMNVPCLPFGAPTESALRTLEYQVSRESSWLLGRIETLVPSPCHYVLMDTPASRGPWLRLAMKAADLVLVVVRPDAACFATLPASESYLEETFGPEYRKRSAYVVNRFDASRALARDVHAALGHVLGDRLLPIVLQDCESVGQALARGSTAPARAASPVHRDFLQLTEKIIAVIEAAGRRVDATSRTAGPRPVPALPAVAESNGEPWRPDEGRGRYHVQR